MPAYCPPHERFKIELPACCRKNPMDATQAALVQSQHIDPLRNDTSEQEQRLRPLGCVHTDRRTRPTRGSLRFTPALTRLQSAALTRLQSAALTRLQSAALTRLQSAALTRLQAAALTRLQSAALTRLQSAALTRLQSAALTRLQAAALTRLQSAALHPTNS
ncbi:hypothetical protein EYF80_035139 [Liparis tanakae]|uniref:Uncharacterized protein n=1 Tax=Liparis tanakae TaxID=230148 RepID=A0A4Z2GM16_9TELE|nr:hypothetical protein EYF80_035139 [Liparis tanakae]